MSTSRTPPDRRPKRVRADQALVAQGLAPSRERARALILAGEVLAGDRPVDKAGELVSEGTPLRLRNEPLPYVSRGGLKLAHALEVFALDVRGRVALDVGASTGGFTDVLLQGGVARVYAIDVGHGQLHPKLAGDPRVVVIDRTNIRHMAPDRLPERGDLAVMDVSFISLRLVLPVLRPLLAPGASVVALVKPQFEVGREQVGKGGVVRDDALRHEAVLSVRRAAEALGWREAARADSRVAGPKGNREIFLLLEPAV